MLSRWERTIVDDYGNRIDQPQVMVQHERAGTPLAFIKADIDGTTPRDNPFIPAPGEDPFFYAAGGLYRITVTKGTLTREFRHVPLGTAAATDDPPIENRGDWAADTEYNVNNLVRVDNATYQASQPSIDIKPGATDGWEDFWRVFVEDGEGAAPILSAQEDGERRVLKVVGWTHGSSEEGGYYLAANQNLADVDDPAAARENIGAQPYNAALFAGIPSKSAKSADYTAVLSDANSVIPHSGADDNARTFTIPANAAVAFPIGTFLCFHNGVNTLSIAITSDILMFMGSGAAGTRALSANGFAVALKISSTIWLITGVGLT